MEPTFREFLSKLSDMDAPIPLDQMSLLSDLDQRQLNEIADIWLQISASRRTVLLEHCGRLADENIELLFEALNRFALTDPAASVRTQAVRNLWECETLDLVPLFLASLTEAESPEERSAAAEALGRFVYLAEMGDLTESLQESLETALLHAVRADSDKDVRRRSLAALGYSARPDVAPFISQFYSGEAEEDQLAALLAMGRSADNRWDETVRLALKHVSPSIRIQAARAAGELELSSAVEELVELLSDIDSRIQAAAIWSLGQIGGERAREALLFIEPGDDETLADLIEQALEHLAFVEGSDDFLFLDVQENEEGPLS